MKYLFALTIAFFLSMVSPAFCQDGPDIFPDEHTRKIARELNLKSVKEIHIDAVTEKQWKITVTDPKVIALLIEGFRTAYTTDFTNKTDYMEVIGKNDGVLLSYRFSLSHTPELSPELIEGFKAAGVEPREWKEREQRDKSQKEMVRQLVTWAPPLAFTALLALFIFKRRAKQQI